MLLRSGLREFYSYLYIDTTSAHADGIGRLSYKVGPTRNISDFLQTCTVDKNLSLRLRIMGSIQICVVGYID